MGKRMLSVVLSVFIFCFSFLPASDVLAFSYWGDDFSSSVFDWEASEGDYLAIDLSTNTGYLTASDGLSFASFPVVTGQKSMVSYIGLYYWAETPMREWVIQEHTIKPDRITFGREGDFYRMRLPDGTFTHYGIHSYRYGDYLLDLPADDRFQSMGCVLVADAVLDVIDTVFVANKGEGLRVVTYRS